MDDRDAMLPIDGRLYHFRNYQSVFPMPEWGSLAQWKQGREKIRQYLWLCTGLNQTTAAFRPKAKVARRFAHEGIIIENIRIETLPGLYVMGNLYRPEDSRKPLPLVLHPHGHGMRSRTVPLSVASVPHRAMNHALNGFAAFAWSMIAHDQDAMQIEHRAFLQGPEKEVCNVLGLSPFGLQLHNGMKVVDYLCGRQDIDPRRIGCTGESGGATQTYYLAALDDRIKVTAPAVMLSGHWQGGCVCENAPHLHLDYSTVHYAALSAPRPMLLTGCTGDWTHHIREREFASLKLLYRLYGKEDAIDCFFQDEKHNYDRRSRERVCAWMKRWLQNSSFADKRIPESKKPVPRPEQLLVHDAPVPPVKRVIRSKKALIQVWTDLHQRPDLAAETQALLGLELPDKADLLIRQRTPKYASRDKVLIQNRIDYSRFSEDGHLTCRFALPERGNRMHLILKRWADGGAWQRFVSKPPASVQKLIGAGHGVIVPLLFGQNLPRGIADFRAGVESSYLFTSYNRTAHEHQARDIVTTVRLAQMEMGVAPANIVVVAAPGASLLSLVAWSALCAQKAIGPFAGDFRDIDFANPAHWVRNAYFPLILRGGGMKSLARLCGRKRGLAAGVARNQSGVLPAGFTIRQKPLSLDELLTAWV